MKDQEKTNNNDIIDKDEPCGRPISDKPAENSACPTEIEDEEMEADGGRNEKPLSNILHIVFPPSCIILSILTTLFGYIAVINCDIDSKYLTSTPFATALWVILAISFILPFLSLFIFKGINVRANMLVTRLFSIIPACAAIYCAYFTFKCEDSAWQNAILVCSLISAVFFVLKIFKKLDTLKILSGIGLFALCTVIITFLYLEDTTIELNSHFKLAAQFGAAALILGTVADSRAVLSRISTGAFVLLKALNALLCAFASGVIITAFCSGYTVFPQQYLAFAILYAACALSSFAELLSVSFKCIR